MATSTAPKKDSKPRNTSNTATRKAAAVQSVNTTPAASAQPAPAAEFSTPVTQPAKAPAKPLEHASSDVQAENALAAMNMVVRDEQRVIIRTPHDPFNQQKLFERSINGLIIVLYADELYSLPKSIAKAIKKQVKCQELSDMTHEEFTTKNGKFIG